MKVGALPPSLKDKAKYTTLGYNLAKHRLITAIANTFQPESKHDYMQLIVSIRFTSP